jgi:undecaprenyl-diphosphatase
VYLTAALLGIVQGLTEFLPVSSSAHLILAKAVLGWSTDPEAPLGKPFDVACHVGTLLAVVIYFSSDIFALVRAVPRAFGRNPDWDGRRIWLIVAGTIPVVVAGLLWADAANAIRTPVVAATALLAGAGLLFAVERMSGQTRDERSLTVGGAFVIGIAQAVSALVPGVSRSGSTIATGMALGLRREAAARFTFLMSVPAVLAAAAKEGLELRHATLSTSDITLFAIGVVTSAVVGYATVKYFIKFLVQHRLDVFAWYRIALAIAIFIWLAR